MSHYLTIPINENGVIFDAGMDSVIQTALAVDPFKFTDVYIYSHGWATDAARALDDYNRFSVELARQILLVAQASPPVFKYGPGNSLGVGIHWPSQITENPNSPLNTAELLTFYTMEHRADAVGRNAVYSMLRLILNERATASLPIRLFMLGHSFGCKVLCAALQDLQVDIGNNTITLPADTSFNVVLLEPATDSDNLESGDIYGEISNIRGLRMLITKSTLDRALTEWYVLAGRLANLFRTSRQALGAVGPTAKTEGAFGGAKAITVAPGFVAADMRGISDRLIVADLTPIHQARAQQHLYSGGISGSHSDIFIDELYQMISGFLFGIA
ncbi:alpha/beta hydrolase [bacterium]|nr:MAG: alpha/beta hydrolase [bacterium]